MIFLYIILGLFILFCLSLMTRRARKYHVENFKNRYIAHRGYFNNEGEAPENSLAAFKAAIDKGFPIELDVQLSKEGEIVVFHDFTLKRACSVDKKVKELTVSELKELKLFKSEEKIPTFKEVLDFIDGRVPLLIELKVSNVSFELSKRTAKALENYKGVYSIQSFNPVAVLWWRLNKKEIARGQLSGELKKFDEHPGAITTFLITHLITNIFVLPDFVSFKFEDRHLLCYKLCKAIYRPFTFCWTIKKNENLKIGAKEFDGVIFDSCQPQNNRF